MFFEEVSYKNSTKLNDTPIDAALLEPVEALRVGEQPARNHVVAHESVLHPQLLHAQLVFIDVAPQPLHFFTIGLCSAPAGCSSRGCARAWRPRCPAAPGSGS